MSLRQMMKEKDRSQFSGPVRVYLEQIDPSRSRRRFYIIEVMQGLFDISVRSTWGRIGSKGRKLEHCYPEMIEALEEARAMAEQAGERLC